MDIPDDEIQYHLRTYWECGLRAYFQNVRIIGVIRWYDGEDGCTAHILQPAKVCQDIVDGRAIAKPREFTDKLKMADPIALKEARKIILDLYKGCIALFVPIEEDRL